jgi:F-type H+-transporting ATPase subunit a
LAFAFIAFFGVVGLGVVLHGRKFFSLFVPSGVPVFISLFLVPIEVLSYFARVLSLAVRLCANMVSGHALLKILSGFSIALVAGGVAVHF